MPPLAPPPKKNKKSPYSSPIINSSLRIDPFSMLKLCVTPIIDRDVTVSIMD